MYLEGKCATLTPQCLKPNSELKWGAHLICVEAMAGPEGFALRVTQGTAHICAPGAPQESSPWHKGQASSQSLPFPSLPAGTPAGGLQGQVSSKQHGSYCPSCPFTDMCHEPRETEPPTPSHIQTFSPAVIVPQKTPTSPSPSPGVFVVLSLSPWT